MRMAEWLASGVGMRKVYGRMRAPDGDLIYASGSDVHDVVHTLTALGGDAATFARCGADECAWGLYAMRAKEQAKCEHCNPR